MDIISFSSSTASTVSLSILFSIRKNTVFTDNISYLMCPVRNNVKITDKIVLFQGCSLVIEQIPCMLDDDPCYAAVYRFE